MLIENTNNNLLNSYSFFYHHKNNIAIGTNFSIEPRIAEQYEKIVNPELVPNVPNQSNSEEAEVIKLFDE